MPPRRSKRKSSVPQRFTPSGDDNLFDSISNKASSNGMAKIDRLFNTYANSSSGMIDPNGIEELCSDLGVCHTDVKILMLAWKLKAANQGFFTKDEWRTGLSVLGVDSLGKLRKALQKLEIEVGEPSNYDDFYNYAFRYCLTEEKQKCLDIECVCDMLNIVLGARFRAQVDLLTEYLKVQSDYKVINVDQWNSFLHFFQEISFTDLRNYDTSLAWPVILDNFVEWMQEKNR